MIRRVELSAGTYAFDLSSGSMLLLACQTEELSEPPTPPSNGDLLNEADQGTGTLFPAAGSHILSLTDGIYRVSILAPVLQPFTTDLSIHRIE